MLKIKNFDPSSISRVDPDVKGNSCECAERGKRCGGDYAGAGCDAIERGNRCSGEVRMSQYCS